MSNMCYT